MEQLRKVKITIGDNQAEINSFVHFQLHQNTYNLSSFEILVDIATLESPSSLLVEKSRDFLGKACTIVFEYNEIGSSDIKKGTSFKGLVTGIRSSMSGLSSGDTITIHGLSPDIILKGKPTCRTFIEQNLEEIVTEVLKPYDRRILRTNISPTNGTKFLNVVQYMESDYDFLKRLAARYGQWFFYSGQELVFGELPFNDEVDLNLGATMDNFNFDLSIIPSGNRYLFHDDSKKEILDWESGLKNIEQHMSQYGKFAHNESKIIFPEKASRPFNHLNVDQANYQSTLDSSGMLEEVADVLNINNISGNSTAMSLKIGQGFAAVSPGPASSSKSYGKYRFTSLSHFIDQVLNYHNSFQATPIESEIPENSDPGAIVRSSPVRAQVIDNKDPDKLGRVVVDYGWNTDQKTLSPWIRCVSPYTLNHGGHFFVPEIDTDVLVAFEDGDMERPYVIGSFNTGPQQYCPDPAWGDAIPDIKAIRTRSGHTIEFHDVDGSEMIHIYDKDKVNEITLDTANKELKIHATDTLKINAKKIEVSASQHFNVSAGKAEFEVSKTMNIKADAITAETETGDLSLKSGGDMKMEAMNIEASAQMNLKAEGALDAKIKGTTLNLEGGATASLKGALVNIN